MREVTINELYKDKKRDTPGEKGTVKTQGSAFDKLENNLRGEQKCVAYKWDPAGAKTHAHHESYLVTWLENKENLKHEKLVIMFDELGISIGDLPPEPSGPPLVDGKVSQP